MEYVTHESYATLFLINLSSNFYLYLAPRGCYLLDPVCVRVFVCEYIHTTHHCRCLLFMSFYQIQFESIVTVCVWRKHFTRKQ